MWKLGEDMGGGSNQGKGGGELRCKHLVQVVQALQAANLGLADVQDLKIGVHCGCEIKGLIAGIDDAQICTERLTMN